MNLYRWILVEHVEMSGATVVTWYSWEILEEVL
jgi:hypothetical protein